MKPVLYATEVTHVRRQRIRKEFTHSYYLWLADIDALPRWPRFAFDDPRPWLAEQGEHPDGRVLMLASATVLGHVFNPLTVFWCFNADGSQACVVAEVHNTYHERHRYLLYPDAHGNAFVDKDFYVSPFLDMGGDYTMHVPFPGQRLDIAVGLRQDGEHPLTAVLRGRRTSTTAERLRLLVRHPLAPQMVTLGIRRRGIGLWLRGLPITPRIPLTQAKALPRKEPVS